jgi:hypothetical protein
MLGRRSQFADTQAGSSILHRNFWSIHFCIGIGSEIIATSTLLLYFTSVDSPRFLCYVASGNNKVKRRKCFVTEGVGFLLS